MTGARPAYVGGVAHRRAQRATLLRFAAGARCEEGFGYLTDDGELDPARPVELYITCRMTHVFGLGALADEPPAEGGPDTRTLRDLAAHGVAALLDGPLRDAEHGGWFAAVHDGQVSVSSKQAYAHAFVVLAASTALTAQIPRAGELLEAALQVQEGHFWDETEGLVVEEWDASWSTLDSYRGLNSCMHTVEAYLAAGAALEDRLWHDRAARIGSRVVDWARASSWRIPEHFDATWSPLLEHNREHPADQFRPYGATVGHGLEWARLLATIHTATSARDSVASLPGDDTAGGRDPDRTSDTGVPTLLEAAVALADRAVTDGWATDGADGFVYTTDWEGQPVVRERMHWVVTEAIATSTVLHWATGEARHAAELATWWSYADRHLIDEDGLSWRHELAPDNTPSARTWPGRPDVYHAYQAALMADTLGAPSFAAALVSPGRRGNL